MLTETPIKPTDKVRLEVSLEWIERPAEETCKIHVGAHLFLNGNHKGYVINEMVANPEDVFTLIRSRFGNSAILANADVTYNSNVPAKNEIHVSDFYFGGTGRYSLSRHEMSEILQAHFRYRRTYKPVAVAAGA
jgi:hypothetical protein